MKRTIALSATILLLLGAAIYAFGDIARPQNSPAPKAGKAVLYTGLSVQPDTKAYEARLQISQSTLKDIIHAAGTSSGEQSMTQQLMHSSPRTIIAGVFMFLAVSFGGVWIARFGQRRNHKVAAAILIGGLFGFATMIVRGNAGPPGYVYWQNLPANLTKGQATQAGVNIEIVPGDDSTIKLIIPMRNTKPSE